MNEEIWKDLPGYDGMYQISNHGNAKSFKSAKNENGKLLKLAKSKNLLLWFSVSKTVNGKRYSTSVMVHSAVFELFAKDVPAQKYNVKHIDGCTTNNHISNLRCEKPRNKAYDNIWF